MNYLIVIAGNAVAGYLIAGPAWAVITPLMGVALYAFLKKADGNGKQ